MAEIVLTEKPCTLGLVPIGLNVEPMKCEKVCELASDCRKPHKNDTKIGADKKIDVVSGVIQRFPRALLEIAKVSTFGCSKYDVPLGETGFMERSPDYLGDVTDADGRHLMKEKIEGPINAEDGDLLHAAQHAWNAIARLEIMLIHGIVKPAEVKLPKPKRRK